jgi:hypothetical protein
LGDLQTFDSGSKELLGIAAKLAFRVVDNPSIDTSSRTGKLVMGILMRTVTGGPSSSSRVSPIDGERLRIKSCVALGKVGPVGLTRTILREKCGSLVDEEAKFGFWGIDSI